MPWNMSVVWPALDGIEMVLEVGADTSQLCATAAPRCEAATCAGGALKYLVVRCCEPVQPLCIRVSRRWGLVPSRDLVGPLVRVVTVDEAEPAVSCRALITLRQCTVGDARDVKVEWPAICDCPSVRPLLR